MSPNSQNTSCGPWTSLCSDASLDEGLGKILTAGPQPLHHLVYLVLFTESPEANMACPMLQEYPSYLHIRDSRQMVWVVKGNSLIAVPSSNNIKPVILSLIACRDMEFNKEGNGTPHYLGIKDKNLCLYCTEIQGYPTLQLKSLKHWFL
ncbi:hypothetical protein E5288_WYG009645 [Bos mutus]|uniref:Interleukin-1 n=1 Tax=Bos mutus TaxID=72004 RepID=A0A6B0QYH4_9CETA|nr:hypothetical protein [Bos mutus]